MNNITRKIPSTILLTNYIISNVDSDFTLTSKQINQSIKNYHIYYDKSVKKKLGKGKIKQNGKEIC